MIPVELVRMAARVAVKQTTRATEVPTRVTIPEEVRRSAPREVRLTAGGKLVTGLGVLALLGALDVGGWLFALALRGQERDRLAGSTQGRIVALSTQRGEHPRWVATYQYTVESRIYQGRATLGRQDRQRPSTGDRLAIRYMSSDPQTSWVEGYGGDRVPAWVAPLASAGIAAVGLGLLAIVRREKRLVRDGRPAIARVTGLRKAQKGHRIVSYEYRVLSGATRTGSLDVQRNPPAPGSEMVVLYDPDNPKRRGRYPMSLVRCVRS